MLLYCFGYVTVFWIKGRNTLIWQGDKTLWKLFLWSSNSWNRHIKHCYTLRLRNGIRVDLGFFWNIVGQFRIYHKERKQEAQTCQNWQTLAVCYNSVDSCSTYEINTQKYVRIPSIYCRWVWSLYHPFPYLNWIYRPAFVMIISVPSL